MQMIRIILSVFLLAGVALANDEIEGVQPAAMDQPRIYIHFHRSADGDALAPPQKPVKKNDPLSELLDGSTSNDVEAFVDTGASGIVMSKDTATQLSITTKPKVVFEDVGVAGSEDFGVTEPLFLSLANFGASGGAADYSKAIGPYSAQLRSGGGILEEFAPALDILGTPVLKGRVIVMDPSGLAKYELLRTRVTETNDKTIPKTRLHVPLTEVSFANYTRVKPPGAKGPESAPNPMIGPSPFVPNDSHVPVRVSLNGKTVTGTFLLDTGAATSMISSAKARELGLNVDEGSKLDVNGGRKSFSLAVGGLGGMKQSSGIYFDSLTVPTREGKPIVFRQAPLLVSDVSMKDSAGKTFTLDGVFGMNYLVGSAEVGGGLVPDVGNIVEGPWKMIVIDLKSDTLGLEPR